MKKRYLAAGAGLGAVGGFVAWKMLSRPQSVKWDDVSEHVPHSRHSKFLDVDGLHIHYQEFGDKNDPTLLLIHGYTSSTLVWKTSAPMFADLGFRVIAVDLVGFGYSSKPSGFDYTIAAQARAVSRFMDRAGIGRATVVGSSYGGAVAATLALDYPERVEKLVLADPVCNDDALAHPLLRLSKVPGIGEVISAFVVGSPRFVRQRAQGTIAPANHGIITDERIQGICRPLQSSDAHNAVLMTARNWDACRIEADAELIQQPTLIVWGENDSVIPVKNGHSLRDLIPNAQLVVFKNCGHIPQEEVPENFVNAVTQFAKNKKNEMAIESEE
jgi:pimeloyl-ACP methyl ester carboxylesterase